MPESSATKKLFEGEVADFFRAYEQVLLRARQECQQLCDTIKAHPSYRKCFTIRDIKKTIVYDSCLRIVDKWDKMEIKDDDLEVKIEDFGIEPKELTCAEEDATESTCLLGDTPQEKKSLFKSIFEKHKAKRRQSRKPTVPEGPHVVLERRKAMCHKLEGAVRQEYDHLKKEHETAAEVPDPESSLPKTDPVPKDETAIHIEEMALDSEILYYAATTLIQHGKYCFNDTLKFLKEAYEISINRSYKDQPSKILGREMDAMLKSKLCFEVMKVIIEGRIKGEKLFAECEKYYEKQNKDVEGAEGGPSKDPKSSRKRTTGDEPPSTSTASPAKQPKKMPGPSQTVPSKLVDVPSPSKEPPKDDGTRRKQKKTTGKLSIVLSPESRQQAGSDVIVALPPPPSKKRTRSIPENVDLMDFNSPKRVPENPEPVVPDLIDLESPQKLPNPTQDPKDDSDDENSTGVTEKLNRASVDDK